MELNNMLKTLFETNRTTKRFISVFVDTSIIISAFWFSLLLRLESFSVFSETKYWLACIILVPCSLVIFVRMGLYRAILRFLSTTATWSITMAVTFSTAVLVITNFFLTVDLPKTVPVIYFALALSLIGGSRLLLRLAVSGIEKRIKIPIIIYGAGSAGRQLAVGLKSGPEFHPCVFIDDDEDKIGSVIQDIPVIPVSEARRVIKAKKISKVLLALPSISRTERKLILQNLENLQVEVQTIPGIKDVIEGNASSDEIRDVDVEDLLGREPVAPEADLMASNIFEQVVMVTGAGGSIGSELCRQILKQRPKKLVLYELSEFALYAIHQELEKFNTEKQLDIEICPLIGSVQRVNRLENVMDAFNVDTVYHAAAYKHVPLVENNIVEGVRNNIFGTMYAARAAIKAGVPNFVLVSTDKAVRPTNVMGATKRMAELVLQALSKNQTKTRFTMVRFGNVLGSSGSVVPLFRRQIKEGGPVTLTHKDITRYFMTIPEAAQLVIQAGAMGKGGDVFVLDMGEPVKIRDLAVKIIRLSGLEVKDESNPHGDIEIACTGLRPGEKLYEELLIGDDVRKTNHERIMTAQEIMLPWEKLNHIIEQLDSACHNFEHAKIREILMSAPTGYHPNDPIVDLVHDAFKKRGHGAFVESDKVVRFKK